MSDRLARSAKWLTEYAIALSVAAVVLLVAFTVAYAALYRYDQSIDEIVDDRVELVSILGDEVVVELGGRKVRGLPLVQFEARSCAASGFVDIGAVRTPCEPGQTVQVRRSPIAYGIRADGRRRHVPIRPTGGSRVQSYPEGTFDAGRYWLDISPRFPGDPRIVAVDIQVTHERWFGPVDELFRRLDLYEPPR